MLMGLVEQIQEAFHEDRQMCPVSLVALEIGQGSLACCSPWGLRIGHNRETELLRAPRSLQMVTAVMKIKDAYSLEEKL